MNAETAAPMAAPMEEPYIGMPIYLEDDDDDLDMAYENLMQECYCEQNNCENWPVAMAYVPWQRFTETYEPAEGFKIGTIFPELNLPFRGGGR